jgi:DNA-binding transcriptional ArsR family regulator
MKIVAAQDPSDVLSATFAALADPTRRQIVERLSRGRATVGELVKPFDMSWPAVTKHVAVLERAGLVSRHRAGLHRVLELNPAPIDGIRRWMDHHRRFWQGSLDSLADYLERGLVKTPRPPKTQPTHPK